MTSSLEGKTVLITGSSGIAAATAHLAGRLGARLCVVGIDGEQVDALVEELRVEGVAITGEVGDLSEEETVGRSWHAVLASTDGSTDSSTLPGSVVAGMGMARCTNRHLTDGG